ncbi:DMT family transporter [Klebsiella aerogenes]|nr:DMT family transporter [Klebsiella aerogenes]
MANRHLLYRILLTMVAFAANSVLCRIALRGGYIDPISFSNLRLLSGALALLPLLIRHRDGKPTRMHLKNGFYLMIYAVFFSVAYIHLDAGTGALLLFGAVQLAMVSVGLWQGETLSPARAVGILLAVLGIAVLLLPGASAPPLVSALLMIIAGLAWAAYTLSGKRATAPVLATAWNFLLALPFALILLPFNAASLHFSLEGITLGILSGAIASAGAYSLWYAILPQLESVTASTVQLSVPCLATLGGVIFLGESLSLRIVVATLVVLAGIFIVIRSPSAIGR